MVVTGNLAEDIGQKHTAVINQAKTQIIQNIRMRDEIYDVV